ncbi:MAG TPA: protein kinase [Candidatus Acidoferrum sp.]|nr:protein kinase [Candidatus Acidoferrum sp.]
MLGQQISHYRITRKIGEGGMGVVYEAEDLKLHRRAALKFLNPQRVNDRSRERFLREARSAAAISHPNICTIYEIDEADGNLFIAMEYCEGQSLRELIQKGALDWATAVSIVIQMADALAEAHRRQIIHRDVKSANILVDAKNRARLLDFGLASLDESDESTQTLGCMGTPAYMAPERFELLVNDARGDIWALGVVLYEAVAGRLPFGGDRSGMLYSILNEYPPALSTLRMGLPRALDEVVDRALSKDPRDRYQIVEEVAADLIQILQEGRQEVTPTSFASLTEANVTMGPSTRKIGHTERVHAVGVLPFTYMGHKTDDFLADGLTEELTNALTQVRGLRVVSRASTSQFKSPTLDLREVGRRLRTDALILGSVRCEERRVRVNAQLVKASNGYQIWSRRFDCEMKSIFDIEDQLTGAIVEHLREWLGTDLEVPQLRGNTSDVTARELYLRGRYSFNLQTERGLTEALQFFTEALERSPRFALARVGMADCYALQGWYGIEPPSVVMPKAKTELSAAIAIEDGLSSAWCLSAAITAGFDWDWERARVQFQKAFSLGPATSALHFHHALDFLTPLGRLNEALEEMKVAVGLDPAAPLLCTAVGGCLYRLRRYPAALRQLQSTLEVAPDFYHAYWTLARVYQALGLFSQAIQCFDKALAASGNNPAVLADAGHCRAAMGDTAGALQILRGLTGAPLGTAIVRLGLKETDAALEDLRQAVSERVRGLIWLAVDPRFDDIHDDPGFRAVLESIGLSGTLKVG